MRIEYDLLKLENNEYDLLYLLSIFLFLILKKR